MKQEIVIKVTVNGPKSRSKALQTAVGLSGVESAGLGGRDKSQIEVVGDGVDAVELVNLPRAVDHMFIQMLDLRDSSDANYEESRVLGKFLSWHPGSQADRSLNIALWSVSPAFHEIGKPIS